MKILFSQIFYPVSIGRYILEALQDQPNIELKTVGPAWGNQIPWASNLYLPEKYTINPDISLPKNINNVPMSYIESRLGDWKPDVVLQVDAGFHLVGKSVHGFNVQVQTDPHCLKAFYRQVRPQYDLVWCMQTPYMDAGEEYLPYAYSDKWFYPENSPKQYDACLIGLHYSQRDQLVHALRSNGVNVYYDIGPVYDEYRQLYNQSKVAISWSSLADTPMRVYEAMGMGIPLVANKTPDLVQQFEDGQDFLGFGTVDQAVAAVMKCLNTSTEATAIAFNGYVKAKENYTWQIRAKQMIESIQRRL